MVLGMMEKNSPTMPVITSIGRKAARVVRVADTTGRNTSAVPVTMASRSRLPPWR
jgi:hypothetical protein